MADRIEGQRNAATVTVAAEYKESIAFIASVWPMLPPHIREAIMVLANLANEALDDNYSCSKSESMSRAPCNTRTMSTPASEAR